MIDNWPMRVSVILTTIIAACVGDSSSITKCTPRQQFSCTCPDGHDSIQTCSQDGNGFSPCLCSDNGMDGGKDQDTGSPSDASVSDTGTNPSDSCTPLTKNEVCTNPSDAGLPFCGNHSDNCGGTINCGSPSQCGTQCVSGESCLTTQVCGHSGTCNLQGEELCNSQSDLCGGSINCGNCNYGNCVFGTICACGRSSSYDGDCSGGTSHAYKCQFSGSLSSPCTLFDSTNHIYCCP